MILNGVNRKTTVHEIFFYVKDVYVWIFIEAVIILLGDFNYLFFQKRHCERNIEVEIGCLLSRRCWNEHDVLGYVFVLRRSSIVPRCTYILLQRSTSYGSDTET
jgi:hypothetical protein